MKSSVRNILAAVWFQRSGGRSPNKQVRLQSKRKHSYVRKELAQELRYLRKHRGRKGAISTLLRESVVMGACLPCK